MGALLVGATASGQENFDPSHYIGGYGATAHGSVLTVTLHPYDGRVPVILDAPFYAEQRAERHQTLTDGTHIDQDALPTKIWRDSSGRTRIERPIFRYETPATRGFADLVVIFDPVAGFQYAIDPQEHVAHRYAAKFAVIPPPPPTSEGQPAETEARLEGVHKTVKIEKLGTQVIEGLLVEGKRTTITTDANSSGNERPNEIVVESWYSDDLRVELLYKCPDHSSADNVRTLTNVNRSEPDAALFEVPQGYTVVDETGTFRLNLPRD